ncbi:MAG: hypothetical protein K0Q79_2697 [Flavipsychrobacter sp.]|jgi:hypothetical protein|nr:hypothetical protein [Flavipsychrobacter sp.]
MERKRHLVSLELWNYWTFVSVIHMRMPFLLFLLILCSIAVSAEDYKKCTYRYFKNKKVSTSECYDANNRFGKVRAYNLKGELIYENEIRKIGGSAHVQFEYYANGAVKKASWRSAPDGGIQWYSSVTTFSEDGKKTGETEHNWDDYHHVRTIKQEPPKQFVKKDTSNVVTCAIIYSSEFWFINKTKYTVTVDATRGEEHYTTTLKPGQQLKGGQLVLAEQFDNIEKYYKFSTHTTGMRGQYLLIRPSKQAPIDKTREVRQYYYDIIAINEDTPHYKSVKPLESYQQH